MSNNTGPLEDTPKPKPVLETKKEWKHGDQSKGQDCSRADKPVYTDPGKAPGICRAYDCYNDHWYGRGSVIRDKNTKEILKKLP